jgi:hypothetical protein
MRKPFCTLVVVFLLGCGGASAPTSGPLNVDIREPKTCSAEGPPGPSDEDSATGDKSAEDQRAARDEPPPSAFEMHATGDGAIAMSAMHLPMYCKPDPTGKATIDGNQIALVLRQDGPLAKCMCDRDFDLKVGGGLAPGKYTVTVNYQSSMGEDTFLTKTEVMVGR